MIIHPTMIPIGPTDPTMIVDAIVVLRRRADHPSITPAMCLKRHEFAQHHGYHPHDHHAVMQFLASHNLAVTDTNEEAKQLTIEGTIADMQQAFQVQVTDYQHPDQGVVRCHDEPILPPQIIALLGLSTLNPIIIPHFNINPANTRAVSVATLKTLYNWPTTNATGQTIGLFQTSNNAHVASDITTYFTSTGDVAPTVITVVAPDATTSNPTEANLDICAAGSAAPGVTIAVYYASIITAGDRLITDTLTRMIHPWPTDPSLTVISISYGFFNDGNATDISNSSLHNALNSLFADAVAQGITVLASAGDNGSGLAQAEFNNASDGLAYVLEPAINPWVVSCGGTVVGNISGNTFEEYVWNTENNKNATGGGVSQFYAVPSYQTTIRPLHINTGSPGRGEPDITGNASGSSGLNIPVNGVFHTIGGTSLTAPLYAGLIAVINASMGRRAGFIHPILYASSNASVFFDITAATLGPPDNATGSAPGYPVKTGWDGSSGLGRPDGKALQTAISTATSPRLPLSYSDGGGAGIPFSGVGDTTFAFTHPPIFSATSTFLNVFITGSPTVTGVNNFSVTTPPPPTAVSNITAVAGATTIALEWVAPLPPGTPPYTYRVQWGTTQGSPSNTATSPGTVFTVTGLAQSTTIFGTVSAVGPTGLIGAPIAWSASTFNSSVAVSNIVPYVEFVGNFFTAVQWDDVGATSYFLDYSTSSTGPWRTTGKSPYTSGFGANNVSGSGFPNSYGSADPHTVNSVHGGHVNPSTGLCDAFLTFWFRVRAQYSDGNITTSAPVRFDNFGDAYPNCDGDRFGMCQSLGTGQLDIQWDDAYPPTSPQDGSTLTYTVRLSTGGASFVLAHTYGPFTTGFGVIRGSAEGALKGSFNHITGIPAGTYYVDLLTSGGAGISGSPGLSGFVNAPNTIVVGGVTYPAITIT